MKVSIVTICKNAEDSIEGTIKSVISQTYKNIEYLIIDGKSTDMTVNIINQYQERLAYFISEEDNGVYEAMNKGILKSTGDIIFFLNSGDYFHENTIIEKVVKEFDSDPDLMFFYGDVLLSKKWNKGFTIPCWC